MPTDDWLEKATRDALASEVWAQAAKVRKLTRLLHRSIEEFGMILNEQKERGSVVFTRSDIEEIGKLWDDIYDAVGVDEEDEYAD